MIRLMPYSNRDCQYGFSTEKKTEMYYIDSH